MNPPIALTRTWCAPLRRVAAIAVVVAVAATACSSADLSADDGITPSVATTTVASDESTPIVAAAATTASPTRRIQAPRSVGDVLEAAGADQDIAGCYQVVLVGSGVEAVADLIAMRDAFASLDEPSQLALQECLSHVNGQ